MMSGYTTRLIARTVLALLLTFAPGTRVRADHALIEEWNRYQELCNGVSILNRGLAELHRNLSGLLDELNAPSPPKESEETYPGADAYLRYASEFGQIRVAAGAADYIPRSIPDPKDENIWDRLENTTNLITQIEYELVEEREICDEARRHYESAVNEQVTDLAMAGPLPDPSAVSTPGTSQTTRAPGSRPPPRRRKPPGVRTTSKPPPQQQPGHRDPASNIATSLFQFGLGYAISRGTKKGSRGGGRPSGGGGGGSSCPGGRC